MAGWLEAAKPPLEDTSVRIPSVSALFIFKIYNCNLKLFYNQKVIWVLSFKLTKVFLNFNLLIASLVALWPENIFHTLSVFCNLSVFLWVLSLTTCNFGKQILFLSKPLKFSSELCSGHCCLRGHVRTGVQIQGEEWGRWKPLPFLQSAQAPQRKDTCSLLHRSRLGPSVREKTGLEVTWV